MKQVIALITLATLAACGVDGEPVKPEPKPKPGISITGRAEIGIAKTS
ncbi:argininosuccinate lyase [uncultured Litoreibacter sp.]|nr:argininosuccinate lyase [uncultured Litoreibacter sp.]